MKKLFFVTIILSSILTYSIILAEDKGTCIQGDCQNGQGIQTFSDGIQYEGQFKNGKYEGQGTETKPDNITTSDINGYKFIMHSGFKYVGQFKNGKYEGQGTETTPDGYKYEGQFKNGQKDGQGIDSFPNKYKYVGQFKNGMHHGQGTEIYPDGQKYEGQFFFHTIAGQGAMFHPDGWQYIGQFRNGEFEGQGTLIQDDKDNKMKMFKSKLRQFKYVGKWTNGMKIFGTEIYSDGSKYVGNWGIDDNLKNINYPSGWKWMINVYEGQGTLIFSDRKMYVGQFKNDHFEGQGTLIFPDGKKYEGQFIDGNFEGQGTLAGSDGKKYIGNWKYGKKNGFGTLYAPNGTIINQGTWINDVFVE